MLFEHEEIVIHPGRCVKYVIAFELSVCAVTGDPGCMDCIEGQCPGIELSPDIVDVHRCTGCGEDDAWGTLIHDPSCPLYVLPEVPL